jgi:Tfp pilus assembly protein PilV
VIRRSIPRRPRDEGITLVEVLVAMVVISIVLLVVTNLFATVQSTTRAAISARNAVGQASNVMDELTRVIRMGTSTPVSGNATPSAAVVAGTPSTLTVTSYVDTSATAPMPTQVAFALSSGALQETRTASVASGSYAVYTGAQTTRTIGSGLTSIAFAYTDAGGAAITPSGTGSTLTAAQRAAVATITVTVTAPNSSGRTNDPIVLTSAVLMTDVALANASGS